MTVIVDYGVGNLFSLKSSLSKIGEAAVVSGSGNEILSASRIILPGVGAFADAAEKLSETGLGDVVKTAAIRGIPILGICLGMQLLFGKSYEFGECDGLALIKGSVKPIATEIGGLKVPHMGWNALRFTENRSRLYKYINDGDYVYFVHSYAAKDCDEFVTAYADYGTALTASVESGNVYGMQFHPEKSGDTGLKILKAFCEVEA